MAAGRIHLETLVLAALALAAPSTWAGTAGDEPLLIEDWRVIEPVGRHGRAALHTDAIEAAWVAGAWTAPQVGDAVTLPDGMTRPWEAATPDGQGWLRHPALRGGYACCTVQAPAARTVLLDARGHSIAYVNGVPRAGNPYATGWHRLPVRLRAGANTLLFRCGRGQLRVTLHATAEQVQLSTVDTTVPDLIVGPAVDALGAVLVLNATAAPTPADLQLEASYAGGPPSRMPVPRIGPYQVRKVPFRLRGAAPAEPGAVPVELRLRSATAEAAEPVTLELMAVASDDCQRHTFISEIDGSVQYYALTPAQGATGDRRPALLLTLHGANVRARNQARAYEPRNWGHVVAPTNRRPFGFDWEDWGRRDALEVLALAQSWLDTDPRRTYLLGHSMGGHGVYHVGVTYPDRFAAIGPSAGWISFWSYAGMERPAGGAPLAAILRRATTPSDTLALSRNMLRFGVYVLHGEQDDNVPVEQARMMREHLAGFHTDFCYYERPGAGHWWGNACVDWPPLMDFLQHHQRPRPATVRRVEFVTANPAISATSDWVTIAAQQRSLDVSRVVAEVEPGERTFAIETDNVTRLAFALDMLATKNGENPGGLTAGAPITIEIDGQRVARIAWPAAGRLHLARQEDMWTVTTPAAPLLKGPHRGGPFKQAFDRRFVLVYGTAGDNAENAAARQVARFDAETFWYRGNGSVDVLADVDFIAADRPERNVILYGNAETNHAWESLLADCPVQVHRGRVRVGTRHWDGADLTCLLVYPRPGSDTALVGVVGGTGPAGMRLAAGLPYFVSGVAYPDCTVLGADMLTRGGAGVRAAGFFGHDWRIESGDFAWDEPCD